MSFKVTSNELKNLTWKTLFWGGTGIIGGAMIHANPLHSAVILAVARVAIHFLVKGFNSIAKKADLRMSKVHLLRAAASVIIGCSIAISAFALGVISKVGLITSFTVTGFMTLSFLALAALAENTYRAEVKKYGY